MKVTEIYLTGDSDYADTLKADIDNNGKTIIITYLKNDSEHYADVKYGGDFYRCDSIGFHGYKKFPRYRDWKKLHRLVQREINKSEACPYEN